MIRFVQGDLLAATEPFIAQGVAVGNQEGLGTGLALKISKTWPDAQRAFKKYARGGGFKGGSLWVYHDKSGNPGIIYLATQPDMYHATMPYLRKSLRRLASWGLQNGVQAVALPKIGAGLGKLSWTEQVKPLMTELLSPGEVDYVVYEHFRNDMENDPGE